MVATLLSSAPGQPPPAWYEATHRHLARQGLRVIALAWANINSVAEAVRSWQKAFAYNQTLLEQPRELYERELQFAGIRTIPMIGPYLVSIHSFADVRVHCISVSAAEGQWHRHPGAFLPSSPPLSASPPNHRASKTARTWPP